MAQNGARGSIYEFDVFRLDIGERLLLREGRALPLTPKAFDLLAYFAEHPQRLLEKSTLLEEVWPAAIVEEANLAFQVSALRKVLDQGRAGESLIETVPTRGYRFVAPVAETGVAVSPDVSAIPGGEPWARPAGSARWRYLATWLAVLVVVGSSIALFNRWRVPRGVTTEPEAAVTRLTASPAGVQVTAPWISRDGRLAVWSEAHGLRVQLIDSGDTRVLPNTTGMFPYGWSADSTAVRASECGETTCLGWEIPLVGEGRRPTGARWLRGELVLVSADGTRLLRTTRGARVISVDTLDGRPPRELAVPAPLVPGWSLSADSRRVLYIPRGNVLHEDRAVWAGDVLNSMPLGGGTTTTVYRADPGKHLEEATEIGGGRLAMVISRLAPGSVRAVTEYSIQVATIDGAGIAHGPPRLVVPWRQDVITHLTASFGGSRLLFENGRVGHRVYVGDYDPAIGLVQEPTRLTHTEWEEEASEWTPDSAAVLLQTARQDDGDIVMQGIDGEPPQALAVGAGKQGNPKPSSDGRWLYYVEDRDEHKGLFRIPLAGGRAERIVGVTGWAMPRCSFRGRCVVEEFPGSKTFLVSELDAEGRKGKELLRWSDTRHELGGFCLLPDGNSGALLLRDPSNGSTTLRIVSLIDQSSRDIVVPDGVNLDNLDPMPDGSLLSVLAGKEDRRRGGDALVLLQQDGTWKVLWAPRTVKVGFAVSSPNGHHLAISAATDLSDIWMASGF